MTLLVDPYTLKESNKSKLPLCLECDFPPAWEVRTQNVEKQIVAHACGLHVDTVLYKVGKNLVGKS